MQNLKTILLSFFITASSAFANQGECFKVLQKLAGRSNIKVTFSFSESVTKDDFYYFNSYEAVMKGEKIGEILFKYYKDKKTLFVSLLETRLKNQGIGLGLFAKVLSQFPEIEKITTVLGRDNFLAFEKAKRKNLSDLDAIKETPAFKIRRRLGYSTIDIEHIEIDYETESIYLVVTKITD